MYASLVFTQCIFYAVEGKLLEIRIIMYNPSLGKAPTWDDGTEPLRAYDT